MSAKCQGVLYFIGLSKQERSKITELDFSNKEFSVERMNQLCEVFKTTPNTIKELSFAASRLNPELMKIIATGIVHLQDLEILTVSNNNQIQDEGMFQLIFVLGQLKNLRHLSVSHTGLTDKSGIPLAKALASHPSLKSVSFDANDFGTPTFSALSESLTNSKNTTLTEIFYLYDCKDENIKKKLSAILNINKK
mmetsp:Transcript_8224/g.12497  ORF Transcript_8224/g.12497 Transcript_8224/m.12497 type:complete len:194 (+) Transcript_8224:19-600(+)